MPSLGRNGESVHCTKEEALHIQNLHEIGEGGHFNLQFDSLLLSFYISRALSRNTWILQIRNTLPSNQEALEEARLKWSNTTAWRHVQGLLRWNQCQNDVLAQGFWMISMLSASQQPGVSLIRPRRHVLVKGLLIVWKRPLGPKIRRLEDASHIIALHENR